jgi:hypothetical protein
MDRNKLNFVVDSLMFMTIGTIGFIGILMGFVIPKGEGALSEQKYLWNLHRHDWGNIHLYLSLIFLGLLIVHIILHWSWVKGTIGRYFGNMSFAWAYIVAPFALLFLLWCFYPKTGSHTEQRSGPESGKAWEQPTGGSSEHSPQRRGQRW